MNNRIINTKVAGGGGCTDIVDNYDPFGGNGVALYQLNGNANDVSGNYNGTASNVTYGTGVFGQAGVFNGSSSYVDTPLNTSNIVSNINDRTQDFTFSCWFKADLVPSVSGQIIYLGNYTQYTPVYHTLSIAYTSSGNVSFGAFNGTEFFIEKALNANTWHQVVGVRQGGILKLYVNGSFVSQITQTGDTSINASATIKLGSGQTVGLTDGKFDGSIDQVRIFNTALTPLEVEALYTEELCICDGTVDTLDILGDGSCIATYQLDGNANDLSGNYSGEATDVSYGVGEFDLAGVFNGSSSYINIDSLNFPTNNFTVSAWVKPNDVSVSETYILSSVKSGSGFFYIGFSLDKLLYVAVYASGSSSLTSAVGSISNNNWYHCLATQSSTEGIKLYLNGQLVDSNATTTNLRTSNTGQNRIGHYYSPTSGAFFNGSIDQVRIFNKALNSTEVTTLYNETACTYTPSACVDVFSDSSGISLYQLNGNSFDLDRRLDGAATNVTWGGAGVFGTSANMKTLQGYIITPTAIYDNSFSGHSVSFWMYSGGTNYETPIYTRTAANPAAGWHIRTSTSGNGINFSWQNSSGSVVFGSSELSFTFVNSWHHVVATWDGTTNTNGAKLYIDGNLFDQRTANETLASQTFTIGATLGADRQSAGRSIQGLDQVRFFNRELTSAEVTTLYTSDASCG